MNDLRSGVCFLLRRGSNTASSFLKASHKQPQVRLITSVARQYAKVGLRLPNYDFTRIYSLNKQLRIKQFEKRMWGGAQWHVIMCKLKGWSYYGASMVASLVLERDLRMQ